MCATVGLRYCTPAPSYSVHRHTMPARSTRTIPLRPPRTSHPSIHPFILAHTLYRRSLKVATDDAFLVYSILTVCAALASSRWVAVRLSRLTWTACPLAAT